MKILGLGLGKTGTSSLHQALQILGFKSIHYAPERLSDVLDGSNAQPDFRRFDDVDAVTDEPAAYFYRELIEAYPNCKCILTLRNEDDWWKSRSHQLTWTVKLNAEGRKFMFGSAEPREFLYRKRYREHNEQALATVPSSRLLVMDISAGDGWEKLCPFLGVTAPEAPFPHKNTRKEVTERFENLRRRQSLLGRAATLCRRAGRRAYHHLPGASILGRPKE